MKKKTKLTVEESSGNIFATTPTAHARTAFEIEMHRWPRGGLS